MSEAAWLNHIAAVYPQAPALALGEHVAASYATLARNAAGVAKGLMENGASVGGRAAIYDSNTPDYITALYGIWWAGMAAVPINAKLHADEVAYILDHAGISHLFINGETANAGSAAAAAAKHDVAVIPLEALDQFITPDDAPDDAPYDAPYDAPDDALAWLFYTSGTTGRPKGAMLSWRNLDEMTTRFTANVTEIAQGDAIIHAAPLSHGSGLYILPHLRAGACQVIPQSGGFNPDELTELLDHWSGVAMFAAPTMVNRWVRSDAELTKARLDHLKVIVYGGAPMYAEDAEKALARFGPKLAQIYGQGESPMTITYLSRHDIAATDAPDWRARLASVGTAFDGVEVAVKTNDGISFHDAVGEVVVKGPIVMTGYWRAPEATDEAIREGWLHTGDIGRMSSDGYLTLMDRSKDLIISGGSNIYPREVEEILLTHPDVQDVAVIGRHDPDWGEVVVAYFVGNAEPATLDALCLERIARFKRPKDYIRIENLPKSHYGKVLKSALRDMDMSARVG